MTIFFAAFQKDSMARAFVTEILPICFSCVRLFLTSPPSLSPCPAWLPQIQLGGSDYIYKGV